MNVRSYFLGQRKNGVDCKATKAAVARAARELPTGEGFGLRIEGTEDEIRAIGAIETDAGWAVHLPKVGVVSCIELAT